MLLLLDIFCVRVVRGREIWTQCALKGARGEQY